MLALASNSAAGKRAAHDAGSSHGSGQQTLHKKWSKKLMTAVASLGVSKSEGM